MVSARVPSRGQPGQARTPRASAAEPIWVCPAVVSLTPAEAVAALYAFSDLMDDVPEPSAAVLREELSFIVARYGTAAIERAAASIAAGDPGPLQRYLAAIGRRLDASLSAARIDWCQRQIVLMFGAEE